MTMFIWSCTNVELDAYIQIMPWQYMYEVRDLFPGKILTKMVIQYPLKVEK